MAPVSLDTVTGTPTDPVKHRLSDAGNEKLQKKSKVVVKKKNRKYKAKKNVEATSPLGVLDHEIHELLHEQGLSEDAISNPINEILNNTVDVSVFHRVVDAVPVLKLTSNGDSLALVTNPQDNEKKQVVVVPFAIPGDVVKVKIYKTHPLYVESDLLEVVSASPDRDESLVRCKYFGVCSGCQYQELTYEKQLEIKRSVIANAYKFFAAKIAGQTPSISQTEPSPLQYSYRTKLTPHFDLPRRQNEESKRPNLGFGAKCKQSWRAEGYQHDGDGIIDIEECVIGTNVINKGIEFERSKFADNYKSYKKGATILLRENTHPVGTAIEGEIDPNTGKVYTEVNEDAAHAKTYVTNSRQIVQEMINEFKFEFSAGEFFQNNNSILPRVIEYVAENLQLKGSDENYLIDAYCGSGLFSITASHSVTKSIGVEISADSVKFAKRNAELNNITNCEFLAGKAEAIFADIKLPRDKTSIILDPPRKGCDAVFMKQLSDFKPLKIIYISCNVHSQARDLEYFLSETENGKLYKVESIKGFDFFPQTHHVESIAVLSLI